jgi:transcriptional regulator with XRE-family HTH domain
MMPVYGAAEAKIVRREPCAMPTVGDRVKQRRLELGLSQDALAERAGISKSFLSDLETGKRSVGAETLLDLGRAMGVSLDFLMTGEGSGDQKPEVQIPASLATFAAEQRLSFRQALTLLHMQEQIFANRKSARKTDLDKVNWRDFYRAVKRFL